MEEILRLQREFQRLCEIDIDTIVAKEINELSETYLFKAIEEIIELRKTFPSELNKWSKSQPDEENKQETLDELSDVGLFLMDFCLVRKITPEQVLEALKTKQKFNFTKLKEKKLQILNEEMQRVPKKIGIGGGSLMPKVVLIGQNPGKSLEDGKTVWDDHKDNTAGMFFKRSLELGKYRLAVKKDDIYFTNVVKEVTENNEKPSYTTTQFWQPFLERELNIIDAGVDPLYLAMGTEASRMLTQLEFSKKWEPIQHPAYFMRNGFSETQYYEEQLLPKLKQFDLEEEPDGKRDRKK